MKNIACVHCNLNKISHRKYFFDLLKTTLKNNMTFKVDNHFGTEGVLIIPFSSEGSNEPLPNGTNQKRTTDNLKF